MYYRGEVEDNNVLFGGFCCKAVRTTETGGVKLIYNGEPDDVYERVALSENQYTIVTNTTGFVFDETDNSWNVILGSNAELSFNVPSSNDYVMDVLVTKAQANSSFNLYIFKDNNNFDNAYGYQSKDIQAKYNFVYDDLSNNNVVKIIANGSEEVSVKIKMITNGKLIKEDSNCNNIGLDSQLQSTAPFNENGNSLAYIGYMYNKVYENKNDALINGAYFGSGFTYQNGVYSLINATTIYDENHHYTCNLQNSTGTCEEIRYYYYMGSSGNYYIELENGKSIIDARNDMLYDNNVNKIDSTAKKQLDMCYEQNMTYYTDMLEDTEWCNNRELSYTNFEQSGWNPNGAMNNYLSINLSNNLKCNSQTDKFSLSNNKANLKYPIGLLTNYEMILTGGGRATNKNFYLYNNGLRYFSMSPAYINYINAGVNGINDNGIIDNFRVTTSYGIRPSISLAYGATNEDGDGIAANPYVINGK